MSDFSFGKSSTEKKQGVHRDLVRILDKAITITNIDFAIIEGVRSVARQRELVARGASKTMNSRHITGHAVDLWPIDPLTGKMVAVPSSYYDKATSVAEKRAMESDMNKRLWALYPDIASAMKKAASDLGLSVEWGGDWRGFPDGPHFQLPHAEYPG